MVESSLRTRRFRKNDDGYKFAIAFSAAISSVVYVLFNYFKDTVMSGDFYFIVRATIAVGILTYAVFVYILC
jgi:hypothetical protein